MTRPGLRFLLLGGVALAVGALSFACGGEGGDGTSEAAGSSPAPPLLDLRSHLVLSRIVAANYPGYAPLGPVASEDLLRDFLLTLRTHFDGIMTYGASEQLRAIPRLAKEVGFRVVIIGLWDIRVDGPEMASAIEEQAHWDVAVVGNEGFSKRYDLDALEASIQFLGNATGKPVSTAEELADYFGSDTVTSDEAARLRNLGDFLAPNVHPWHQAIYDAPAAQAWVAAQVAELQRLVPGRLILVHETGMPSGGHPRASETLQADFWDLMERRGPRPFAYFEAVDMAFKATEAAPFEGEWGLYDENMNPKLVMQRLAPAADNRRLVIQSTPPRGENLGEIAGDVVGWASAGARDRVVLFAAASPGWWLQPTFAEPFTPLNAHASGFFFFRATSHGANSWRGFLVDPSLYEPPTSVISVLPSTGTPGVIAIDE